MKPSKNKLEWLTLASFTGGYYIFVRGKVPTLSRVPFYAVACSVTQKILCKPTKSC